MSVPTIPGYGEDVPCRGKWDLFFPAEGKAKAESIADVAAAKRLCAQCPVQAACLQEALARHEPVGVWGGFNLGNPKQVRAARRQQLQALPGRRQAGIRLQPAQRAA